MDFKEITERFAPGWSAYASCGEGWNDLIFKLHYKLLELDPEYRIYQIKEKFGGLRYYIEGNKEAQDATWVAEDESFKTCEVCGEPGELRQNRWWKTLCDKHDKERNAP